MVGWSLPGASDSGEVKGQKVMIRLVIDHVDVRKADPATGGRWYVLHPSNDAILAYCDTEEEAGMVRKALNKLAAELAEASR